MKDNSYGLNEKNSSFGVLIKKIIVIISICMIAFITGLIILKTYVYPIGYFDTVKTEASKNGIDPYLILSIIKNESNFNPNATSNKDAKGLMQIIYATAKEINDNVSLINELNKNDLYDAQLNIAIGCNYFSSLIKRYNGNYYLAICAYNAGMGNVDKWISQGLISSSLDEYKNVSIPFKETENYLKNVVKTYKMYKMLY